MTGGGYTYSRRTIYAGRRRPWRAISALTMRGSRNVSITPQAGSRSRSSQRTGKVYNHSKRMKEKRAVLDGVAAELRRIIGEPAETELRLVA